MILLLRFLDLFAKLFILFLIISFERVVGLPVFFLTVSVSFMLIARSISKYVLFVFAAFLLAIFYQHAFVISFLLLFFLYVGFVYGSQVIESNLQRFITLLLLCTIFIVYAAEIKIQLWSVAQLLVGLLISSVFLLKFVFVRYGFLGKKMTTRR